MPCCNQDNQQKQATERGTAESGPMAMGMGMARKMMGQGGSPMDMMQKMMAQMGQGMGQGGGPPQMQQMMQMCMGMCSEMLDAIRQTTAMAASATPALQQAFDAWLKDLEGKAEAAVAEGEKDVTALAAALGIDEESTRYVLGRLAANGKVTLIARPRT